MSEYQVVYQGQFGEFTITPEDKREVMIYRGGLIVAALSFLSATILVVAGEITPLIASILTGLYAIFSLGLGVSLMKIHIYLRPLHLLLKAFWGLGTLASVLLVILHPQNPILWIYTHPLSILGVGFIFAALTGIYFKEAFCFNRIETKVLTPIVPCLLLGHLTGILTLDAERILLVVWSVLFMIFAIRKAFQEIPDDIGDKSVFEYLKLKQV
ncbi:MAG: DUF2301 domain-containing membrane protein [Microcystaceae cyanobacterium]